MKRTWLVTALVTAALWSPVVLASVSNIKVRDMGTVSDIAKTSFDSAISYTITQAPVTIGAGTYRLINLQTGTPIIETSTELPKGTVLKIIATPAQGYALDLAYAATSSLWGLNPEHSLPEASYEFPLHGDTTIGATFIEEEKALGYKIYSNIKYGETAEKHLIYDVVVPSDLDHITLLPIVFVVHGGGWTSGDPSIMIQMARQIAKTRKYVVCLMNYRFLGTSDGGATPYNVSEQIEDVFGAMAHFLNLEPEKYHADKSRFVVTGDSAGGHLAASIATVFDRIGTAGFDGTNFEFWPTGLRAQDVVKFRAQYRRGIKAMAPNYGVFDLSATAPLGSISNFAFFPGNARLQASDLAHQKVSPAYAAMEASVKVPAWQSRGTSDPIITQESVLAFKANLDAAGWPSEDNINIEVENIGHAFYDWKVDEFTQTVYQEYGEPHVNKMISFFDRYVGPRFR